MRLFVSLLDRVLRTDFTSRDPQPKGQVYAADFLINFLDAKHVLRVCREYVAFHNRARPSQALHAIPEPCPELVTPPRRSGELIALPVLGGVQHDYRLAA